MKLHRIVAKMTPKGDVDICKDALAGVIVVQCSFWRLRNKFGLFSM